MKRFYLLLVAIGIEGSTASGAILTFEGIAEPAGFVNAYSIVVDGFSFVSSAGLSVVSSTYFYVGSAQVENGTDYLLVNTFSSHFLRISDNTGRPFAITSFSAVEGNHTLPGGVGILAVGNFFGGGTVSQTFITAPHPIGVLGEFQEFAFSPEFTGLESLVLTTSPVEGFDTLAIDNLQMTIVTVPEPVPTQLVLVGIAALLAVSRCKRQSP